MGKFRTRLSDRETYKYDVQEMDESGRIRRRKVVLRPGENGVTKQFILLLHASDDEFHNAQKRYNRHNFSLDRFCDGDDDGDSDNGNGGFRHERFLADNMANPETVFARNESQRERREGITTALTGAGLDPSTPFLGALSSLNKALKAFIYRDIYGHSTKRHLIEAPIFPERRGKLKAAILRHGFDLKDAMSLPVHKGDWALIDRIITCCYRETTTLLDVFDEMNVSDKFLAAMLAVPENRQELLAKRAVGITNVDIAAAEGKTEGAIRGELKTVRKRFRTKPKITKK